MITVIGMGYVGLTTAVGFASKDFKVYGYEIDGKKLEEIKNGKLPFHEPELDKGLVRVLENKKFIPTNDLKSAVEGSEVIMFCVGTPSTDKGVDLTFLRNAVETVIKLVNSYKLIIIRSTVPPGTTSGEIKKLIEENGLKVGDDIGLANNPEFLREGHAWEDFMNPERVVIGTVDDKSWNAAKKLYLDFGGNMFRVSLNTGEYIKYLSNSLLATMISFSNEMATFAEIMGDIDIPGAFKIVHMDKRWYGNPASMATYVYPGCGFGGACLPKDTLALARKAESIGYEMSILKSVLKVNEDRKSVIVENIKQKVGPIKDKSVAVLGLAFKPNTTDVRRTPSKLIIEQLLNEGAKVKVYDPMAMEEFKKFNLDVQYATSLEEATKDVYIVVILTAWEEFKTLAGKTSIPVIDARFMLEGD